MQDMEEDVSRFFYDDHDAYLLFFIFSVLGAFFPSRRKQPITIRKKVRGVLNLGWSNDGPKTSV